MPACSISHQNEWTDNDVQQPAERHVGDESAGQYGVKVPNVTIRVNQGGRIEKQPTDRVSHEGIGRSFGESDHGNPHALENEAHNHDARDQTKRQKVLTGEIRDLLGALFSASKVRKQHSQSNHDTSEIKDKGCE